MRRIAVINQKGGVGKTTTATNLAAALVDLGRRVVVVDMDPQANLSLHIDCLADSEAPSTYTVLTGGHRFGEAVVETGTPCLRVVPANIDLSGAETELASAMGRETILDEAIGEWVADWRARESGSPADYLIFDCPPSLGLLALNALAAAGEVLLTVQTEFLALQGMSKLVEIVQLVRKRLNPDLVISGILPCMYDSRLRLAREVLAEIREYFPGQVLTPVGTNVKLAEAPSFGQTIFQYAPESKGAQDYLMAALELLHQESRDPELAGLERPPLDRDARKSTPRARPSATAPKPAPRTPSGPETPAAASTPTPEPLRDAVLTPTPPPPAGARPRTSPAPATSPAEPPPATPEPAASPQPPPPRAGSTSAPPRAQQERSSRVLRAQDLPPLPHDAFENYLDTMR